MQARVGVAAGDKAAHLRYAAACDNSGCSCVRHWVTYFGGWAVGAAALPALAAAQTEPVTKALPPPPVALIKPPEPVGDPATWLPLDEYPVEVRAAVEQRRTVFALEVDDKGRILQCNIVESSGSTLRDSTTCGLLISNGQFKPARDAAGKAVAGTWQSGIRFNVTEAPAAAE